MGPAYKVFFRPASGAYSKPVLCTGSAREAELNPGFEQHEGVPILVVEGEIYN